MNINVHVYIHISVSDIYFCTDNLSIVYLNTNADKSCSYGSKLYIHRELHTLEMANQ